jgi:DNA invertase Pin-like site-specific DNA recombinase
MRGRIGTAHLERRAVVYVRQSTMMQVHEHAESRQRQYALVERAVTLGWARSQIDVVDEDQGKSGATAEGRAGFARLADAVARGEVGAVFALEVSRLARSSTDWQRLLHVCSVADVYVGDEQSVYDPSDKDDKLLLDLKGTMSEAELHWLRLRLVGGRMNKARRGELELRPPTGYVWGDRRFEFDPDEAIQRAIRLLFERFAIEPTAWAVVRWAKKNKIKFPSRRWFADGASEVKWRALTHGHLVRLLHNPSYAGVYTYGRRQQKKLLVDGAIRKRTVSKSAPADWPVRIDNAHRGYIDWETFVKNQERLKGNQSKPQGATRGAPNRGPALLAGLVVCGRCGRRMRTMYEHGKQTLGKYICLGEHDQSGSVCWSVPGARVDLAVEQLFLQTMVPTEVDLSLAVEREVETQAHSLDAQWRTRLEQVAYEARRAERRYKAVDPDNRVVARTLEREWEERLREMERQYAEAKRARRVSLTDTDRDRIRALARDLPSVWRAPTTNAAERKAMLGLVIEAIALHPVEVPARMTRIAVQWTSGAVSELLLDRPHRHQPDPRALERLKELVAAGHLDEAIAEELNREGLVTGLLRPWTARAVARARLRREIPRVAARKHHRFLPDRHPTTGDYSLPGTARRFGVPRDVVRSWIERGIVRTRNERFGAYNARWLAIDDATAEKLTTLAAHYHKNT